MVQATEATLNSEEIKAVAIAFIKLRLTKALVSESVSQSVSQLVSRKFN